VSFTRGDQIENGDAIFHLNFRSDRGRQLTQAIMVSMNRKIADQYSMRDKHFMTKKLTDIYLVTMTKYYNEYDGHLFIKPMDIKNTLGEVLAEHELRQLHIAETEKYAHVTKFFNGDQQIVYDREKDILVPSHKVATFDLDPEMSADEIYSTFINNAKDFDFSVINFANGDIVGHTGIIPATIKAMKKLGTIVQSIIDFCKKNEYDLLITADHGNCEEM